ncbi:MAG: hypothetical protein A2Y12_00030 [Planctomycetes bacterium GWF2_42_9]|nr:MAG: hypothetical protein A2Y12_00030 [Planctomycetes bacterium GWF2_42_9]
MAAKSTKQLYVFTYIMLSFSLCSVSEAARWNHDNLGNTIESVDPGQDGNVVIGDTQNKTWLWSEAQGIGFKPGTNMPVEEDSNCLSACNIAGGQCQWTIKFNFTKPISKFRFKTPLCTDTDLSGGDFSIAYATDQNPEYKEIYRYGKETSGYAKDKPIEPYQIDWVNLDPNSNIKQIALRFNMNGYIGNMQFHANTDDGGVLEYTTKSLPIEETATVELLPNASEVANTYYVYQSPRAVIDLGNDCNLSPTLEIYDLGRKKQVRTVLCYRLDQKKYFADLINLQTGVYELRFILQDHANPIKTVQFALVHPARQLTWQQTVHSPFGLIGIDWIGRREQGAYLNGPALGRIIGTHQTRCNLGGWLWVEQKRGEYNWHMPSQESSLETGLVYRWQLSWTPGWALDMERVKAGGGGGAFMYPAKPEFQKDYAEFCRQCAQRATGVFQPEFEMQNEANGEPFGSWKGTFEEYVERNHIAADAVHSVNPNARMILGTCGGVDLGFIVRLLKAGLNKKFDIIDLHPYQINDQGPEDGLLSNIRRIQKVIQMYGNNQSIIFSEIGWPTYPSGQYLMYDKVTRFQQACYYSRTLFICLAAGVERLQFHMLMDIGREPSNAEHHFGIVDVNGQPKLALAALSTTQRHLEQAKFKGVAKEYPDFHHVWAWETPWIEKGTLLTIWCDTSALKGKPQWITLPAKPITTEDLWGGEVTKQRLKETSTGWQILPDEDPIFVYVPSNTELKFDSLPNEMRPQRKQRIIALPNDNITVDGNVAEWGALTGHISLNSDMSTASQGWAGVTEKAVKKIDSTTDFSVSYNNEGLFIATKVKSDVPMQNDFNGYWIWRGDSVRLYISTVNSHEIPYFSENHFSPTFAPVTDGNRPGQVVHLGNAKTPSGVAVGGLIPGAKVAARKVNGGWELEGFVPWEHFSKKPAPEDIWDFDIAAGGHTWNGGPNNWNNPLPWGELEFGKEPNK